MDWIYFYARRGIQHHYKYRNGPVPFIHCSRASGHTLRYPRNLGEKKNVVGVEQDYHEFVKVRGKRKICNLTDNYDDICVARREDRSWKNYRLTRYKTK